MISDKKLSCRGEIVRKCVVYAIAITYYDQFLPRDATQSAVMRQ